MKRYWYRWKARLVEAKVNDKIMSEQNLSMTVSKKVDVCCQAAKVQKSLKEKHLHKAYVLGIFIAYAALK